VILRPATLHAHRRGVVHVPLNLLGLPERVEALGEAWHVKTEHHVTALDAPWLAERLGRPLDEVWAAVAATLDEAEVGPVALGSELRRAERSGERTLVVMCAVGGLAELHAALGAGLGAGLEVPPAHVTLYTDAPGGPGIGLHDAAELAALSRVLDGAEAAAVRAATGLAPAG
jgi:hypothetical protein